MEVVKHLIVGPSGAICGRTRTTVEGRAAAGRDRRNRTVVSIQQRTAGRRADPPPPHSMNESESKARRSLARPIARSVAFLIDFLSGRAAEEVRGALRLRSRTVIRSGATAGSAAFLAATRS